MDLNNSINAFIENVRNYSTKEKIQTKDYFDIVENRLNLETEEKIANETEKQQEVQVIQENEEKYDDVISKLPLLELNVNFIQDVLDSINSLTQQEKDGEAKQFFDDVNEVISFYKQNNTVVNREVSAILQEVFESLKQKDTDKIKEAKEKFNVIKQMAVFKQENTSERIKDDIKDAIMGE